MARLTAGDEAAIEPLYDRYGKLVYSLALHVVRDGPTAEELTQEAFVRLWRSAASFEPGRGVVRAWLLRIAHNLALNELRRRRSRPVVADTLESVADDATFVDTDAASDPAAVAVARDRGAIVRRALAQLPQAQRRAIELAYFGGLSQVEVAAATGDPLGTVKSRIRVGMSRLRDLLLAAGVDATLMDDTG